MTENRQPGDRGMRICGLARAMPKDIERCYDAVRHAPLHRIHTFLATSDLHLDHKLKISRAECVEQVSGLSRAVPAAARPPHPAQLRPHGWLPPRRAGLACAARGWTAAAARKQKNGRVSAAAATCRRARAPPLLAPHPAATEGLCSTRGQRARSGQLLTPPLAGARAWRVTTPTTVVVVVVARWRRWSSSPRTRGRTWSSPPRTRGAPSRPSSLRCARLDRGVTRAPSLPPPPPLSASCSLSRALSLIP
jgi:hypothetical protein